MVTGKFTSSLVLHDMTLFFHTENKRVIIYYMTWNLCIVKAHPSELPLKGNFINEVSLHSLILLVSAMNEITT